MLPLVRTAQRCAAFFLDELAPGMSLIDVGCGPGTITVDLAGRVAPGRVVGVDADRSQTALAAGEAARCDLRARFETADPADLPFADAAFDRAFSHGMLEHLADPAAALSEIRRVLRPGGRIGVCVADWCHALVEPADPGVRRAVELHVADRRRAGADPGVGHRLAGLLARAGFTDVRLGARLDVQDVGPMSAYLGRRLDDLGVREAADAARRWPALEAPLFAMCWIDAVATA
jgi:SAM-dependent methyltransferase